MEKHRHKRGFTLIEILLYVSLASVILLTVSAFLGILLQSRVKNQVVAEVEQQAQHVIQTIGPAIRNAEDITSPLVGGSATSLTLDIYDAADDPTVFDLSGGVIRITEGAGSVVDLTTSRVNVSSLTFTNITKDDTPGTVRIEFTISYNSSSSRQEFSYSKDYYATYNLRQP